ncbi:MULTISPECIES: hypothetical protein [Catenuloplanes]|uniref:Uncharacterized protein n=1 Tax=Catenuloplanes niger TaxID=587534 RepID=A0AAE4CTL4_9ACTN|nr:hypothetical protein [Catenuloplanes niger]MDR7323547.1 hypothetical protein [Catenuloplanes niger]
MSYDSRSPALAGNERAHPVAVALVAIAGVVAAGVFGTVVVRFAGADSRAADRLTGPPAAQAAAVPSAPSPSPSPSPSSPSPSPSSVPSLSPPSSAPVGPVGASGAADECLAGVWRVAEQRELVALPGIGTVEVTLTSDGPEVTYAAAGTGVVDYGAATGYAATVDGRDTLITVAGTVTFEFVSADGRTAATQARSAATFTVTPDGGEPGAPAEWPASLTEWSVECGPGELTLTAPDAQTERLVRIG